MKLEVLAHGAIDRRRPTPGSAAPALLRPTLASTEDGSLLCLHMTPREPGADDLIPVASRSRDNGKSWRDQGPLWPRLLGVESIDASLARGPGGTLTLLGTRRKIGDAGSPTPVQLIRAHSTDHGKSWDYPVPLPTPDGGPVRADGPLVTTRIGTWIAPCSPMPEPNIKASAQTHAMVSRDRGLNWKCVPLIRLAGPATGAMGCELTDGRVVAAAWSLDVAAPQCLFSISRDGGLGWSAPRPMNLPGRVAGLLALPATGLLALSIAGDGSLHASAASPTEKDLNSRASIRLADRADSASAALLPDGDVLIASASCGKEESLIASIRLRLSR